MRKKIMIFLGGRGNDRPQLRRGPPRQAERVLEKVPGMVLGCPRAVSHGGPVRIPWGSRDDPLGSLVDPWGCHSVPRGGGDAAPWRIFLIFVIISGMFTFWDFVKRL